MSRDVERELILIGFGVIAGLGVIAFFGGGSQLGGFTPRRLHRWYGRT